MYEVEVQVTHATREHVVVVYPFVVCDATNSLGHCKLNPNA